MNNHKFKLECCCGAVVEIAGLESAEGSTVLSQSAEFYSIHINCKPRIQAQLPNSFYSPEYYLGALSAVSVLRKGARTQEKLSAFDRVQRIFESMHRRQNAIEVRKFRSLK